MGTRSAKDGHSLTMPALPAPADSIWELRGLASRGMIEGLAKIRRPLTPPEPMTISIADGRSPMIPSDCLLAKRRQKTEEVMNDIRFPQPITLEFSNAPRKIDSSFEALECLDQQWPKWARGPSWRAADRACRDALDGWRSGRAAYKAFLKAAKRAGLTRGRPPSLRQPRSARMPGAARPMAVGAG